MKLGGSGSGAKLRRVLSDTDHRAIRVDQNPGDEAKPLVEGVGNEWMVGADCAAYPIGDDAVDYHLRAAAIYPIGKGDELHCSAAGCVLKQPYLAWDGGVVSPCSSQPQQATEPSVFSPQVW